MKSKTLLIIGSIILILGGGFLVIVGFAIQYMLLAYYGGALLIVGIIDLCGALLAKDKKAGYFFIIMGIAIWLPVVLAIMLISNKGGNAGAAALCFSLPALVVTLLWCAGGVKNIS